ncbi:hypothetical protein [Haloechinothrix halophila]|uniref:hypothetical protein n=1 Tax=Haloechinothrix halophila TaxID=1069073 RepID=UPI00054D17FE|nr:hypothetical protein [Haloechinothrix halophila]
MTAPEVNFSDLSNKPKDTVRKLERSRTRSLRVHRRGADEDLVLTTASRAAQTMEVSTATIRLFLILLEFDDGFRRLVNDVMPGAFPWVRFLPEDDVREFATELIDALAGGEALKNPAPAAQVITSWRHTAEVHADPELFTILTSDGEDLGAVPQPAADT